MPSEKVKYVVKSPHIAGHKKTKIKGKSRRTTMNLPIRAIIIAARKMGATVFKIARDESGEYDFQFKFNGVYRKVSLQTILEYGGN